MPNTASHAHHPWGKCIIQLAKPIIPKINALFKLQWPLFAGKTHDTDCNAHYSPGKCMILIALPMIHWGNA